MSALSIGFTGSPLDRADRLRNDADGFNTALNDWRARLLALDGGDPTLTADGSLTWRTMADAPADAEFALLGLLDERPHFVMLSDAQGSPPRNPALWQALSLLPAGEAAIYATARALIDWHANHRFCAGCGSTAEVFRAGWGRRCGGCQRQHFPRTDPVVIMLAEWESKALVGRQAAWPQGSYSALAGYLEPGESIEEAVRREIEEEAGIKTGAVRYIASQPWPFGGAQLMIACIADALGAEIVLDTTEIEDAKWVSRDEVRAALAGDADAVFRAPPPFAIAHSLFQAWIDRP